jgi:putative ABC transport system substrate-binding protein
MAIHIRRREFIVALGGAAAWPLAARSQQPAMPVIGFLSSGSPDTFASLVDAFRAGLKDAGYVEGRNVAIQFRWALGQYHELPALAQELVQHRVTVLVASGGDPAALAAKAATSIIPIIFLSGGDPVKSGIVASLSRPGGNATGVSILSPTLEPKRLGLLRELVPQAGIVGVLLNPDFPPSASQLKELQQAGRAINVQIHVLWADNDQEIEAAFASAIDQRIPALLVGADPFLSTRRNNLANLAARHSVPTLYPYREYALAGGLMSYGINIPDLYRDVGSYTGKILKGAQPAELPVLQPTKFELVINAKTAKALGIKISDNLLSLADEVIE